MNSPSAGSIESFAEEDEDEEVSTPTVAPATAKKTPAKQVEPTSTMSVILSEFETIQAMTDFDGIVDVNLAHPEKNREVFVFRFDNYRNDDDELLNGNEICIVADIRHFRDENYRAWVISDNEVVVQLPTVPYAFMDAVSQYEESSFREYDQNFQVLEQPHIDLRNDVLRAKRFKKYLLLRFPTKIDFDNNLFSAGFDETDRNNTKWGEIKPSVVPYVHGFDLTEGKLVEQVDMMLYFRIGDKVITPRYATTKAPKEKINKSASILGEALSGMDMGDE